MKRDWGLIRAILQKIEEKESYGEALKPEAVDGYDVDLVSYHMLILDQAGLITAHCRESTRTRRGGIYCVASNLTWEGYELLDKIRSDTVWNRVTGLLREKSLDFSYDTIKLAAMKVIHDIL